MQSTISYLIPCYNHEKYLPELLNNLTLDIEKLDVPAEVIIIDDGSEDNSALIIKEWENNNTTLNITFISGKNKGLPAVLNQMIKLAKGEYLRLGASDDVILPGSTQLLFNEFINKPSLRCAVGDGTVINETGECINKSSIDFHGGNLSRLQNPRLLVKELVQNWCVAGPAHLIKKNHYNTMSYDESLKIDDYDLFLSLLKEEESIVFTNKIVCLYRVHTTNTSKTKNLTSRVANLISFICIIDKYIKQQILVNYLLPIKYKSMAKIYYLQKRYLLCAVNMSKCLFYKFKSELLN